jgi:hypothetical protein
VLSWVDPRRHDGGVVHSVGLLVLLAVLTTARITRLINADAILDRPRAWVQAHAGDTLTYFVQCPWCVSIWVGGGVAAATYAWHGHWAVQVLLIALTASYVTGLLAMLLAKVEDS